jgi:hypothetical protein
MGLTPTQRGEALVIGLRALGLWGVGALGPGGLKMARRGKGSGTTYYHKGSGRWCAELNLGFDSNGKLLRVRGYHKTRK